MNLLYQKDRAKHGTRCNFGGDSTSQANTTSNTNTQTNQWNTDNSMQIGDGGIGINGSHNIVDKSVVNNTTFTDTSNRSTNTTFTDKSNRSVNTDNHSITNFQTTDFGSVGAALSGMGQISNRAIDNAGSAVLTAMQSMASTSANNANLMKQAMSFASDSATTAASSAKETIAASKSSDQTQMIKTLAIAGVAAVGFMAWGKK
jgi:hypothetical protein